MEPTGAKMLDRQLTAKDSECPEQDTGPQASGGPDSAILRGSVPLTGPWFHSAAPGHTPHATA